MERASLWIMRPIWFWATAVQFLHQGHNMGNSAGELLQVIQAPVDWAQQTLLRLPWSDHTETQLQIQSSSISPWSGRTALPADCCQSCSFPWGSQSFSLTFCYGQKHPTGSLTISYCLESSRGGPQNKMETVKKNKKKLLLNNLKIIYSEYTLIIHFPNHRFQTMLLSGLVNQMTIQCHCICQIILCRHKGRIHFEA